MLNRIALAAAALVIALAALACGEQGVDKFVSASLHAQHGIGRGIPAARALRLSGAVSAAHNLRLARKARLVNSLHQSAIDVALSGDPDGGNLLDQIQALLREAEELKREGTVKFGGKTEIIFDLGIDLARGEMAVFADSLKSRRGVKIPVSQEAREKLEQAKAASERNAAALDEAVRALEALTATVK